MKKKILLFYYIGGAGGKFIANCLSFSKQVVFTNYNKSVNFLNNDNFDFLEKELLSTIPEKENHRRWILLEQGCHQLFGADINRVRNNPICNDIKFNDLSVFNGMWLPLVAHDILEFNNYKKFFSNDTIFTVLVDGTSEFIDLAIRLKWPEEHHCLDLTILDKFKNSIQSIDFDFIFNDWNPLKIKNHAQIIQLAKQLECDFDLGLAKNYIQKYIDFHNR